MVFKRIYPLKFQHINNFVHSKHFEYTWGSNANILIAKNAIGYIMLRFDHQIKLAVLFANYIIKYD